MKTHITNPFLLATLIAWLGLLPAGHETAERGQTGGWFRSLLALGVAGMPRTMRMEYPGAIDHVMDRGDRRESGSRLAGKVF